MLPHRHLPSLIFSVLATLTGGAISAAAQDGLFVSKRLTPAGEYSRQIEGPAVDAAGNLYVANLKVKDDPKQGGAIGRVKAGEKKSTLFATLPVSTAGTHLVKSKTSGIRFDRDGRMYATDFNNHNIFVFEPGQSTPTVYFHDAFHQPNDLAIAKDGTLYASDPLRPNGAPASGRIWRIARGPDGKAHGEIMKVTSDTPMGAANGIDLSPDEKTLYVGEADTNRIRAYQIDGASLTGGTIIASFPQPKKTFDLDGLRTDMSGRIFVTHNGGGRIAILKPDGTPARAPVATTGKNPSNLTFGGPDGKTVFVTQAGGGYVETFRVDIPGREPCMQLGSAFCNSP
jgi:sugar lactone lactonase YvrE